MAISKKIAGFLSQASWIRRMFEEGERLRALYGADKVYDFTLGNPDVEPPAAFKEELRKLAANPIPGMHRYMSNAGYEETRRAVAEVLAEETGLSFRTRHVVMTVGAGGGLNVVLKTLLDQGDEVIVLAPYFVEYRFYVDNHGGVIKEVPTGLDFQPDLAALEKAITSRTKAVIINSPNNPTGVIYEAGCLAELGKLLDKKGKELGTTIYLISDEPYAKIVYDGIEVPSVFQFTRNSIVVTSHSKDLALPGERIGYIAVHPEIDESDLLLEGLVFCNRTLGFVNAPALMQRLVAKLQREKVDIAAYQEKRDLLYNHLVSLGFEVVKPQGAFYLFPRSPLPDDLEFARLAQKHNILVVPGSGFGLAGYFRISYCISKQIILNSLPAWTQLAREVGLL
ncbi:pyridoxal phosphate-dependent aminotransferase [Desulfofundulus thermosubterraneus]|uniref:Aspartate aminotransferase n=1 Tax=Desulfofundulus thermosubterraneus DSM 16057 TaxID=1121432 RepID=A0A1M6MMJ2_9FIRM|nr:pyridoxal phosphate-dependent aminotransferase [Desulfofundulus thermosubterraneus]SHJ84634.1 aspartate aminotransferase [Desulfofundulus thermosubterraneus DSM 16057]